MLLISVILLSQITSTLADCGCLNDGKCNKDKSCTCPNGFYGTICQQYAEAYKIEYEATPLGIRQIDIINSLKKDLVELKIQDVFAIGENGNVYVAKFHKTLTSGDRKNVKSTAFTIANLQQVEKLSDYNECKEGEQSCFKGFKCINTMYSFKCECPSGYKVEKNNCVKENDANTRTVIYVWAAALGGVILFTLACLMFFRHRKIEKGKKTAIEQQKKMASTRGTLTPTNLSEYGGPQRQRFSPAASVVDKHTRYPMTDGASIYSYNVGNYGQPDNVYYGTQSRLSIPNIDNMNMSGGYDPYLENVHYPSSTGTFKEPEQPHPTDDFASENNLPGMYHENESNPQHTSYSDNDGFNPVE